MWFISLALSAPLVTLSPDRPSWSVERTFAGPTRLDLEVEGSALSSLSRLTVLVDGKPVERQFPGPELVVELGDLRGRHRVTIEADLREPGHDDCDPGEAWIDVRPELDGAVTRPAPTPASLQRELRGRSVHVETDDSILLLEAAAWLARWDVDLRGDSSTIRLRRASETERHLNWTDDALVVTGDPAFVRHLATGRSLERCLDWPCRFPSGPLVAPVSPRTFGERGFQRGLTVQGQQTAWVRLAMDAPARRATLVLGVRRGHQEVDPSSTVSIRLQGEPLGTWSVNRLPESGQLEVALPGWALGLDEVALEIRSDLRTVDGECSSTGTAPWLSFSADSGLMSVPRTGRGLAGDARRIRSSETTSLCLDGPASAELAMFLVGLRPTGGWRHECSEPDLKTVSGTLSDGAWTHQEDPVPLAVSRWVVQSGTPVSVHLPGTPVPPPRLSWAASDADQLVSTRAGWSAVGDSRGDVLVVDGAIETDERFLRKSANIGFGVVGWMVILLGGLWVWRGRGDRSGWTEDESTTEAG